MKENGGGFGYGDLIAHAAWCRRMFDMVAEGGVWGIPRSGVVLRKEDGAFVVWEVMPHDPSMPVTAEELLEQQRIELESVRRHFAAAGVEVRGEIDDDE